MVDLIARGNKIKAAFAKKKATPTFSAITIKGDSTTCEISQSIEIALHFSDGSSHELCRYGTKITHFSGYDASNKRRVAWMLRDLADRLEKAADDFSKQYDEANENG